MSPTLTDDALVHELRERAGATLPPMGLRPDAVLAAGRRYRRRRTAARAAGAVAAVAAVAVVAGELAGLGHWDPTPVPPARVDQAPNPLGDGQTVELAPGIVAANRPVEITLPDGTPVLDLGITTPGATQVPATGPLVELPLVVAPITTEQLEDASFPDMAPPAYDSGVQVTHLWESGLSPFETPLPWSTQEATFDYEAHGYLQVPPAFVEADSEIDGSSAALLHGAVPATVPDPRTVLFAAEGFHLADGRVVRHLEIPMYRSPTEDERLLWTVRMTAEQEVANLYSSPTLVVLFIGSDGSVVPGLDCGGYTLDECAAVVGPEIYAAADLVSGGIDTLRIETATDVRPVETDDGPAFDLGVQVGDGWDQLDQDLTYALRAGALVDGDSRTPDQPGLWLVTLAPDGSTITGAGGSVDEALAPDHRNPIWSAGLTDHEAYVVGIRPPALEGATFELVIETDGDDERTPIPTFRVAGLNADVWFVALTDPVARTNWQAALIVVTATDGSASTWNLAGHELKELTVEPGGQ